MIELRTLGTLELASAGGSPLGSVLAQPRRAALLIYLALARPHGFHRRDTLYALFWPDHDPERARHALRQSVYFLRRALGAEAIAARGDDLAVDPRRIRCDACEFERAVEQGRPEAALALYRADLLPGFHVAGAPEFERWLDGARAYLAERAAEAAWNVAEARERAGDAGGAAALARRAAAFSPTDETVLRRLMLLLDRVGDRAAAVRAYEDFERILVREYELVPSDETRALIARIRSGSGETAEGAYDRLRDPSRIATPTPMLGAGLGAAYPGGDADPQPEVETRTRTTKVDDGSSSARAVVRAGRHQLALWIGAVGLLALLGTVGWWVATRADPARPSVERVVVADFKSASRDSTLGDLVATVLRAELARSPILSVVGRARLDGVLRRMRLDPGTRLEGELAREAAVREGVKIVVEGEVQPSGTGLVLRASVVEAATGDIVHGAAETVSDSTQILPAIRRLAGEIRRGAGESLASVQVGDSLWRFTTTSLAALQKHVQGSRSLHRGDLRTAIALLEEAVALDPEFAHAHLLLATSRIQAGFGRGRALPSVVRAYELRERLTERERFAIEGFYHLTVSGELEQATAAFQRHVEALRRLPPGEAGWYSSYGWVLALRGDLAEAKGVLEESRARFPTGHNQARLVQVLYALGDEPRARLVLEELSSRFPQHPRGRDLRARLLAASGRLDDAHALAEQNSREFDLESGLHLQAELDAMRGRLGEAIGHLRELRNRALARENPGLALEIAVAAGRLRLLAGDPNGVAEAEGALDEGLLDSLDVLSRPYLPLALLYADAGLPRKAREWLDAYEHQVPRRFRGADRLMLQRAQAAVRLAEGEPDEALKELRQATGLPAIATGSLEIPPIRVSEHTSLARVYERLGAADSAIAVYERYLAVRSLERTVVDAAEFGIALERLARLYETRGNHARAASLYRRLGDLWRGADPSLSQRAATARQRALRLEALAGRSTGRAPSPPRP